MNSLNNVSADVYSGLACFVLDSHITKYNLLDTALKFIQKEGFTILQTVELNESQRRNINFKLLDSPFVLVIALDVYPLPPKKNEQDKYPELNNKRLLKRNLINEMLLSRLSEKTTSVLVSGSNNEKEALAIIISAGLDEIALKDKVHFLIQKFATREKVLKDLSATSRRAKVELIEYDGKMAVKKTFKPGQELYFKNELEAYAVLKDLKEIPQLLSTGDNFLITEYLNDAVPLHRVNLSTLKKCLNVLKEIYRREYSFIDFHPENILIDKNQDIHFIDFEFFHKYISKPDFFQCYDLHGCPADFDIMRMPGYYTKKTGQYNFFWFEKTLLRCDELKDINNPITPLKIFYRRIKQILRDVLK